MRHLVAAALVLPLAYALPPGARAEPAVHHPAHHAAKSKTEKPAPRPDAKAAPPADKKPAAEKKEDTKKPEPDDPHKGRVTGLPLPRFVALKTDDVDMRVGPGTRYPVQWVYKRRNMPIEVIREFDVWRLVQDSEGVKGWMHQGTLTGHRTFMVTGGERVLRAGASEDAAAVARLQQGVIGRLRACEAAASWCQVQVGDYRGWLRRDQFWGIEPGEAVQ